MNPTHAPAIQTCQPYSPVLLCSDNLHIRPCCFVTGYCCYYPSWDHQCLCPWPWLWMTSSLGLSPASLVGPWTQSLDLCPTSHKSFWNVPVHFCFYPLLSTAQTSPRNLVGQEAIHYISAHFSLSPTAASTLIRVSSPSYRTKASRFRNGTNWYRTGRMGSVEEDESCS